MKSSTTYTSLLAAVGLLFGLSTQPALGLVTVNVQPGSQVASGEGAAMLAPASAVAGGSDKYCTSVALASAQYPEVHWKPCVALPQ